MLAFYVPALEMPVSQHHLLFTDLYKVKQDRGSASHSIYVISCSPGGFGFAIEANKLKKIAGGLRNV